MTKAMNFFEAMKAVYEDGETVCNDESRNAVYYKEDNRLLYRLIDQKNNIRNAYFCDLEITSDWYIYEEPKKEYTFWEAFCLENKDKRFKPTSPKNDKYSEENYWLSDINFGISTSKDGIRHISFISDNGVLDKSTQMDWSNILSMKDLIFVEYKPENK
jgi:hypothetical protein